MLTTPLILIVAQRAPIRNAIAECLRTDGYVILPAYDAIVARETMRYNSLSLVIVDLSQWWQDGADLFREVPLGAQQERLAHLVLASDKTRLAVEQLLVGADADTCLVTPFTWTDVRTRVRLLLRHALYTRRPVHPRTSRSSELLASDLVQPRSEIRIGDLRIDIARREVVFRGVPLELTARLFDLPVFLASRPGEVLAQDRIITSVWGYVAKGASTTLHVHIRRLREKLERDPSKPQIILTVPQHGYRFASTALTPAAR
jgi:DNA-binding response OmpR family regulator